MMTTEVDPVLARNQFEMKFKRRFEIKKRAVDSGEEENCYAITDVNPAGEVLHLVLCVSAASDRDSVQGITFSAMHAGALNENGYPSPDWP